MELHEALQLVEVRLGIPLNDNERDLLKGVLEGLDGTQTYRKYFDQRIRQTHFSRNVAPKLWKKLGEAFGEKVGMRNVRGAVERAQMRFVENSAGEQDLVPSAVPSRVAVAAMSPVVAEAVVPLGEASSILSASPAALSVASAPPLSRMEPKQDWGSSPRVSSFCGRRETLKRIETHLRIAGCQLFSVSGEAGVGKTWFAKQLAQNLMDQYDTVVWRTLRPDCPTEIGRLLADLVTVITRKRVSPPVSIAHFLDVLMEHPSLIVLDGIEAVLAAGVSDGSYLSDAEAYGRLLQELSQRSHYSCVVIAGREKPRVFSEQAGNPLVCSLSLAGFEPFETQEFFQARRYQASPSQWLALNRLCDGNPRALHLMDGLLRESYGGEVESFLEFYEQPPELVVADQQAQFERLSPLEQTILSKLSQFDPPILNPKVLKAMELEANSMERRQAYNSLIYRSLLRPCSSRPGCYVMPMLMREYILEHCAAREQSLLAETGGIE